MHETIIIGALLTPFITGILSLGIRNFRFVSWMNLIGSSLTTVLLFDLVKKTVTEGPFFQGFLLVDALSALFLLIVGFLGWTATLYSFSYMSHELSNGHVTTKMVCRYYGMFQFFVLTMIFTLVVENLGLIWVAVEATTLISALLVAFYLNRSSVEAAWKYVMVCSVGIALALLGTILLYYAQVQSGAAATEALGWLALRQSAGGLNPDLVKLAVVFILVGYGTKAGLAPMHTWLPDAHSQAPTPVSGLLSGALLSCAVYAILRNLAVVNLLPEAGLHAEKLLIGFGLFSVGIAVPFLLLQHDVKRLLAYSSVENMGLVALGIGSGTKIGLYGALFHLLNHAVGKSALFYVAGVLIQQFRSKQILRIRGVIQVAPLVAGLFVLLLLAVSGLPPFGMFFSKLMIIQSLFQGGWWQGLLTLLLLAAVFSGMLYYLLQMVFGAPPAVVSEQRLAPGLLIPMVVSLAVLLVAGTALPDWLAGLLGEATEIVAGRLFK